MRVLCCPTSLVGSDATRAARVMADGWRAGAPHDAVRAHPVGVGRDVLDALLACDAGWREVDLGGCRGLRRADELVLDAGEVLPRWPDGRAALLTSGSAALGPVLLHALAAGVRRLVVVVPELAVHDAGAGLLRSLGVGAEEILGRGAAGLLERGAAGPDVAQSDGPTVMGVPAARSRVAGCQLVAATASTGPLLGLDGVSARAARARALGDATAQHLESALGWFVHQTQAGLGALGRDLISGRATRLAHQPGSGAGGGLGYGLAVLGARLRPLPVVLAELADLDARVAEADLVVTGGATFDAGDLRDSALTAVGERAMRHARPVVVVAGRAEVGRREAMAAGVEAVYAVDDTLVGPGADDPDEAERRLRERVARVARTWSRP